MDSAGWDERYAATELVWSAEPNRFVVAAAEQLPRGRALDLAAGEGRNAIWLAEQGWSVTAVDFSPVAIDKGRQIAARRGVTVEWAVADVRTYRPEPGGFDAVFVVYLHLAPSERGTVLANASRALAPGGTLIVIGHDVDNLSHGVGGPQDPTVLYRAEDIVAQAPELEVLRAGRMPRPVQTEDGARDAIDTVVWLRKPGA